MYSTTIKQLTGGVKRVMVTRVAHDQPVEFAEVNHSLPVRQDNHSMPTTVTQAMHLLGSGDTEFIHLIASALQEPDGFSYFWEHPPVTSASARRPYEFVVAPAPALQRTR